MENIKYIIGVALVVFCMFLLEKTIGLTNENKKLTSNTNKLISALNAEMKTYKNIYDEVVSEKLTIQADLNNLKKLNESLNDNQKMLFNKIQELNKKNEVIAAALIDMNIDISNIDKKLESEGKMGEYDNNVIFDYSDSNIEYSFSVNNIVVDKNEKPIGELAKLTLPNTQTISFQWEKNRRQDYPVSFSVSNSNPYFKVYNIESYIIPEINKKELKPTGWDKITNFTNKTPSKVGLIGIGIGVGFLLAK
jgi:hypothetical protein